MLLGFFGVPAVLVTVVVALVPAVVVFVVGHFSVQKLRTLHSQALDDRNR